MNSDFNLLESTAVCTEALLWTDIPSKESTKRLKKSVVSELLLQNMFAYLSSVGSDAVLALSARYERAPSRFPKPLAVERATFLKPRIVLGLFRAFWYEGPELTQSHRTSTTRTVAAIMQFTLSDALILQTCNTKKHCFKVFVPVFSRFYLALQC